MNTQELFKVLETYKDKSLLFEYTPNQFVGANYHITEVKHISIDAVDCGSETDAWKETIIQLWESPSEIGKREFMPTYKALGILNKVGEMKPYDYNAEVKFEYSNTSFHTAQLFVNDYEIQDAKLIIKLAIEKTDCKANAVCGVETKIKEEATAEEGCCAPASNCC